MQGREEGRPVCGLCKPYRSNRHIEGNATFQVKHYLVGKVGDCHLLVDGSKGQRTYNGTCADLLPHRNQVVVLEDDRYFRRDCRSQGYALGDSNGIGQRGIGVIAVLLT